jgi:hypothetical protein
MKRRVLPVRWTLFVLLFLIIPLQAQSASPTVYAESFRKGSTRVTEESFEVKLNPANPTYRERIKDSGGNDRYELTITPLIPGDDNKVTSWLVKLRDLHHTIYSNLLLTTQQPSTDPMNNLWWLKPDQFAPVSIRARRIVKVEGFYVVFQVKDFHFTPIESPYLDSMSVHFAFTNSDPRSEKK